MAEEVVFVVPVYNEEENLRAFCEEWLPVVRAHGRLLLIDDGSKDSSPALLDRLAVEHPEIRVVHKPNGGHGSAIMMGYRLALEQEPRWVFQVDSDRQFEPADFEKLWELRERADFIAGARAHRSDPRARIVLSAVHRKCLRILFGVSLVDPNTPFRLMRAPFLRELLTRIPDRAFAPNVFLSLAAARQGERLITIPVTHRERSAGKISIHGWKTLRIGLRCFRELLQFRSQALPRAATRLESRRSPAAAGMVADASGPSRHGTRQLG